MQFLKVVMYEFANVASNVGGCALSEELKKSTVEECGATGAGDKKEINRSETNISVDWDRGCNYCK